MKGCTQVVSNCFPGMGIAPVPELLDAGLTLAVGTDDVNCNGLVNLLSDMKTLVLVHRAPADDPSALTAEQALEMATINGARAVEVQHPVVGDAQLVLRALLDELKDRALPQAEARRGITGRIRDLNEGWIADWMPGLSSDEQPLSPYRVIWDLLPTVEPAETIVTHDAGSPRDQMSPFWVSREPLSSELPGGEDDTAGVRIGPGHGSEAGPAREALHQGRAATVNVPGMMTGAQALAEMLDGYGVTHVFMVPAILRRTLVELERFGVRRIHTHGEKPAAYMADGYARMAGRPGVCMAQAVGALNLAAGLRDAHLANSPVIALTGGRDPGAVGEGVYQEVDDLPAFVNVTKFSAVVDAVEQIPDLVRQAFRSAVSGRPGPVHLQFVGNEGQIDRKRADLDPSVDTRFASVPPVRPLPDPEDVAAALDLLDRAERPVLVAGGGVRASRASGEFMAVAERLTIPVVTSLNGKDTIPGNHPLCVGGVGTYSRGAANRVVNRADLVCFVGSSTGSHDHPFLAGSGTGSYRHPDRHRPGDDRSQLPATGRHQRRRPSSARRHPRKSPSNAFGPGGVASCSTPGGHRLARGAPGSSRV